MTEESKNIQKESFQTGKQKVLLAISILLFLILCVQIFIIIGKNDNREREGENHKQGTDKEETIVKDIQPTPHCPTDYKVKGDICEKIEEETPQTYLGCPEGSIEIGPDGPCGTYKNEGEQIKRCPPMPTILEKEINGKLYCYTKKRSGESCGTDPDSSYFENGYCYYSKINSESTHNCSSGLVSYKGKCYTRVGKINMQACKETYTLENNKCTRIERTDQIKTCPSDYELKENKCIKKG